MARDYEPDVNIGETDAARWLLTDDLKNYRRKEIAQYKFVPDQRGTMMQELLRSWGMVAAKRGEDDQTGRATLQLLPVEEVVSRAAEMTDLAFSEMKRRGWLADITRPPETE